MASFLEGLPNWTNYEMLPGAIIGFHGCDRTVGEALINQNQEQKHLLSSTNDYDWLGTGIYFWELNPLRALQFAQERAQGGKNSRGTIQDPFVLGALINPGRTLNLADSGALLQVRRAYDVLHRTSQVNGKPLPTNGRGLRARQLDCLVFNLLHELRAAEGLPPYDSVRGLFWEGDELYPGAGLREANHIQICVRNPNCILGYFRPIENQM